MGITALLPGTFPRAQTGLSPAYRVSGKSACLVTGSIPGLGEADGTAAAHGRLVDDLCALGYRVTILFTRHDKRVPLAESGTFRGLAGQYGKRGITLSGLPGGGQQDGAAAKSFALMRYLLSARHDLVIFDEAEGLGYYSLLSRDLGHEAFRGKAMWTVVSGQLLEPEAQRAGDGTLFSHALRREMEQAALERADGVLAAGPTALAAYRQRGFRLPDITLNLPLQAMGRLEAPARAPQPVEELVFITDRSRPVDVEMFCAAVDRLAAELDGRTVSFIGGMEPGLEGEVLRRAAEWPHRCLLLGELTNEGTLSYLLKGRRLAVFAGASGAYPALQIACLERRIPFLAARDGVISGYVKGDDAERVLYERSAGALGLLLVQKLEAGAAAAQLATTGADLQVLGATRFVPEMSPAAGAERAEPVAFILLTPGGTPVGRMCAAADRLKRDFGSDARVVFLKEPFAWAEAAEAKGQALDVVLSMQEAAALIGKPGLLTVSHISQLPTPEWLGRALTAFLHRPELCGVTGHMLCPEGGAGEDDGGSMEASPETFLFSPSKLVSSITWRSNGGFVTLLGEGLALLSECDPLDRTCRKFKHPVQWVHTLIGRGLDLGRRIELIPDAGLSASFNELGADRKFAGDYLRARMHDACGAERGSEAEILSRFVVDAALGEQQQAMAAEWLRAVLQSEASTDELRRRYQHSDAGELMGLALRTGQVEEALVLAGHMALPGFDPSKGIQHAFDAEAKTVHLLDEPAPRLMNGKPWTFEAHRARRLAYLHPNSGYDGRATIVFEGVDLRHAPMFSTEISLINAEAAAVRCRIDLYAAQKGAHTSAEAIVVAGEAVEWRYTVPEELRGLVTVTLSVEPVDPTASPDRSRTAWHDPAFRLMAE